MSHKTNIYNFIIGISLLFFSQLSMAEEEYSGALAVVEEFHATLLNTMQNADALAYRGRYDSLAPVIHSCFDTPLIAKVILGRYWKELDEQQQSDFINLFNKLSTATYASRFDSYSTETFKTSNIEKSKKGRVLVRTELIQSDLDKVRFDYLMHVNEGRWTIISVIANGVNDLALKKAEYANVIKEKGLDGLIGDIKSKIEMYEKG